MEKEYFTPEEQMQNISDIYRLVTSFASGDDIYKFFEWLNLSDIRSINQIDRIKTKIADNSFQYLVDNGQVRHPSDDDYVDYEEEFWQDDSLILMRIDKSSSLYQALNSWYSRNRYGAEYSMANQIDNYLATEKAIYFTYNQGLNIYASLLGGTTSSYTRNDFIEFIAQ